MGGVRARVGVGVGVDDGVRIVVRVEGSMEETGVVGMKGEVWAAYVTDNWQLWAALLKCG